MNFTNLKADCRFLCGATSATYLDADITRNLNNAYQHAATIIWQSADGWQYSNGSAKSTLTHNTQSYTLPTTAQKIQRVEVKDTAGIWHKLTPIDSSDINVALPEFQKTIGLPIYYDLVDTSVFLYPTPSSAYTTMSSGVAFYMDKDVTEFATSATTTSPGFSPAFHRILSYAAAIDFIQDQGERDRLIALKSQLEQNMRNLYSKRNIERPSRIRPRGANTGSRQYI